MANDEDMKKKLSRVAGDKYRSILNEEDAATKWRHGGPPIFDAVNSSSRKVGQRFLILSIS